MVKKLFSRLVISKRRHFDDNLSHESQHGTVLEIDPNGQWFVAVANYRVDELKKDGGAPNLILFRKQGLSVVARMRLVVKPIVSELFIGDFTSDIENRGYGSILLRNVIRLAELLGCHKITGNLSTGDYDHFDKLSYLYSKYGFEVNISGKTGSIILRLG